MKQDLSLTEWKENLRRRAEDVVEEMALQVPKDAPEDVRMLVYDLRMHQTELEMQNEDLRNTQEQLVDARDRLEDLYDFAPVGYFTLNSKGIIVEANLTLTETLGIERSELLRSRFSAYVLEEDEDVWYLNLRNLKSAHEKQICELRLRCHNSAPRWVELECVRRETTKDGDWEIRTTVLEIDRRKKAEEDLAVADKRYRTLVEVSPAGIYETDELGKCVYVNPAWTRMTGIGIDDALGDGWSNALHPNDRARVFAKWRENADKGGEWDDEYRFVDGNGNTTWVAGRAAPIRTEDGATTGYMGINIDATDRKGAELALAGTFETLLAQQVTLFELATSEHVQTGDVDAAVERATELGANLMNGTRTSVWELDESRDKLICRDMYDSAKNEHSKSDDLVVAEYPRYFSALKEVPVVAAKDALTDPKTSEFRSSYLEPNGITSMLDAAIWVGSEMIGVLCHEQVGEMREWLPEDVSSARALADLLGRAMEQRDRARDRANLKGALATITDLRERIEAENIYLRERVTDVGVVEDPVGRSDSWMRGIRRAEQVAQTDASVLLLGETGTGKDTIAQFIHVRSDRRDRSFVHVSCAALPASLIESELFGHERGAFTGAVGRRLGRFEVADGGTLFLDEVGELPPELQLKLLRVLERGEFERVGSTQTQQVDVRLIAATNRDLELDVAAGRFREDLYFRLGVFPIWLPPLRERLEDIPLLSWYFINRLRTKLRKQVNSIPQDVMGRLLAYDWPGNVRELENVLERAMILSTGASLEIEDTILTRAGRRPRNNSNGLVQLDDMQRAHILDVLEECGWKIKGKGNAAEQLGLHPSTLYARMKKLGIKRPNSR